MHLAIIVLAHGKGRVEIRRDGGVYQVTRSWATGECGMPIVYIEGETPEDTKARAIGALQMLDHWPKLIAALAEERRIMDAKAGRLRVPPRHTGTRSGVILP